ncbi:MAG: hypothetical protein JHC95_16290 [Solirubrobacteraceae bacterium]|nr:hypothetical protein [Solirubrobacteraceae bacterium]
MLNGEFYIPSDVVYPKTLLKLVAKLRDETLSAIVAAPRGSGSLREAAAAELSRRLDESSPARDG